MPPVPPEESQANAPLAEETFDVRLVLKLDFETFIRDQKDEFVHALAASLACPVEEIQVLSYSRGCVVAEVRLPKRFKKDLLLAVKAYAEKSDDIPDELRPLVDLMRKYSLERAAEMVNFGPVAIVKRDFKEKAVIFVHGWTGDGTTFGKMPHFVGKLTGIKSSIFTYPTGRFSHSPTVADLAGGLRNWIRNSLPEHLLAFVVHSLGGLVVRQFLVAENDHTTHLDLLVRGVCFIASPHEGSRIAEVAERIPGLRSDQLADLRPNSGFLTQLDTRWGAWVRDRVSSHEKDCMLISLRGTNDKVVRGIRARGLSEESIPILGRDHTSIVQPVDENDEVVTTVVRFLKSLGFDEPSEGPPVAVGEAVLV